MLTYDWTQEEQSRNESLTGKNCINGTEWKGIKWDEMKKDGVGIGLDKIVHIVG